MTPHDRFDSRLQAYLDGELDRAETLALEAELKHNADLAAQLELLRRVTDLARASRPTEPPEGHLAAIRARLQQAPPPWYQRLFPGPGRPAPALAWGTVTTCLLAVLMMPAAQPNAPAGPTAAPAGVTAMPAISGAAVDSFAFAKPKAEEPLPGSAESRVARPELSEEVAPAGDVDARLASPATPPPAEADAPVAPPLTMMAGGATAAESEVAGDVEFYDADASTRAPRRRFSTAEGTAMMRQSMRAEAATDYAPYEPSLQAGEIDDNATFGKYLKYWHEEAPRDAMGVAGFEPTERYVIQVVDRDGRGVADRPIEVRADGGQSRTVWLRSDSSGQAVFFPSAAGIGAARYEVAVDGAHGRFAAESRQPAWRLELGRAADQASLGARPSLDVAFVVDTTGSMSEEIDRIRETIDEVAGRIAALPQQPALRLGLVLFRDQGDEYVTKVKNFTPNVQTFQGYLQYVAANGGGDGPEDVCAALDAAVDQLDWTRAGLRAAFLVGDAPPHLDYANSVPYLESTQRSAAMGIKWFAISTSGNEDVGELVWRQLALLTRGRFLFITKGGAAGVTPHHVERQDYTVQALPDLVVRCVERELAALGTRPPEVTPVDFTPPAEPVVQPPPPPAPPVVIYTAPAPARRGLPAWAVVLVLLANLAGWGYAFQRSRQPSSAPRPPRGPRWQPPASEDLEE